jgi:hypothetical protein
MWAGAAGLEESAKMGRLRAVRKAWRLFFQAHAGVADKTEIDRKRSHLRRGGAP